jgi:signal transduction histidine kinase
MSLENYKLSIPEKERVRVHNLLLQAEKLANICHYEVNIKTNEVYLSDQGYSILGMEVDGDVLLTKESLFDLVVSEDKKRVVDGFTELVRTQEPIEITFKVTALDGKVKVLKNSCRINHLDVQNNPTVVFGVAQDVTEITEANNSLQTLNQELEDRVNERTLALHKSQELYSLIARNFPNGEINVFDRELNYVFAEGNELYKRGITSEMLIGTSFLNRLDKSIRAQVKEKLNGVFNGENAHFELKLKDKVFMIFAVGLSNEKQEVDRIMMVTQNITGQKIAEENTKRALEKEQSVNDLKSRFLSMASHQFRTPLTSSMNSANLLSKYVGTTGNEEKKLKHIERIKNAIHHLTNILDDFLSVDRLTDGKIILEPSAMDAETEIKAMIEQLEGILRKDQKIVFKFSGNKDFNHDMKMLTHVFNNLISNASKYSDEGSKIHVEVKNNDYMHISIKDEGIGIPLEDQPNLFGRFFRANNVSNIKGTGLGLNIVKNYIDLANGEITFVSSEKGTEFNIKLPQLT